MSTKRGVCKKKKGGDRIKTHPGLLEFIADNVLEIIMLFKQSR
jgi:hypothetical protein